MLVEQAVNIDELRKIAKSKVPSVFYDYLIGGANSEKTLTNNKKNFNAWELKQKVLIGSTNVDLSTNFLGSSHKLPIMLGPIGFAGMYYKDGEIEASYAADEAGIAQCISTFSICSIENVSLVRKGPLYFQLYIFKNRDITLDMLERCRKIGIDTIFLTVDTPCTPIRERDERNGFRTCSSLSLKQITSMLCHPVWLIHILAHGMPAVHQLDQYPQLGSGIMDQVAKIGKEIDHTLTWEDMRWLREQWEGRLVVKGILSAEDAGQAVDAGADAIVISNHGGRQLDPVSSTIRRLPEISRAVNEQVEIIFDGGIRRGADIIKALALGANAVSLGRAYIFGLAAGGRHGVFHALELLHHEMEPTMKMMGISTVNELRAVGIDALRYVPNDHP
ncbi:alpha-hydroxy acid oxidase [Enterobacter sp. UPMP2060]